MLIDRAKGTHVVCVCVSSFDNSQPTVGIGIHISDISRLFTEQQGLHGRSTIEMCTLIMKGCIRVKMFQTNLREEKVVKVCRLDSLSELGNIK